VLARLEAIDGVEQAEIDHRGELLRLRVTGTAALDDARRALTELGYEASEAGATDAELRWYGSSTVRELSREEARIIAGRVVPDFASRHGLTAADRERLSAVVAEALYACFSAHTLGAAARAGALRAACAEEVARTAAGIVGVERARDLAARIEADLSRSEGAGS